MWTHPAIECLLNEVRKRRSIYDQQHVDYLNREKRRAHFESICKVVREKEGLDVAVEDVKSKVQVLRSQLNKELRYMARSKKYKPKLWCFKKMEFLRPFCGKSSNTMYNSAMNSITNGHQQKQNTVKMFVDHMENMSSSTFDADIPSSSNNLTSKEADGDANEAELDPNQQFYDMITLTQQMVQNRVAAKQNKDKKSRFSWEGELVRSQLELIIDETIRNDTLWEIQCVLRRGIEQDRVLPRRRRNRQPSLAGSEISANGSCISLDSNDSKAPRTVATQEENNVVIE